MKLVVGYDQALAAQCYKRNLRELIRPESSSATISPEEVNYFAERLAETSVFSVSPRIGSPWMSQGGSMQLVKRLSRRMTRLELVRCEHVANNMLILEGIVSRDGAFRLKTYEEGQQLRRKIQFARALYIKASTGTFRPAGERKVLLDMSRHVPDWIRYLSILPGHDYMDLLKGKERSLLFS